MPTRLYLLIAVIFSIFTSFMIFLPVPMLRDLAHEDHFFENQQAITCFLAAALLYLAYRKDRLGNDLYVIKTRRNIFFLLMALAMFVVGGEEISWGQRILHLHTPTALARVNTQQEINFHNLLPIQNSHWLNVKFLFPKLCLAYFLVFPLVNRFSPAFARFVKRVNLPMAPLSLGLMFLVLAFKYRLFHINQPPKLDNSIDQLKESDMYVLMLMIAAWFLTGREGARGWGAGFRFGKPDSARIVKAAS